MVTARNTREDVVRAAGKLFADKGYHGTSMRDLGSELGLLGSSLYAHIESKQDLLVEVVQTGARLFEESATAAFQSADEPEERLAVLIGGHVDVVLDNLEVARTFLNEAKMLDEEHRERVIKARDGYEERFRDVIIEGMRKGRFRPDADPKLASIFILSALNAVERWYRPAGALSREQLKGKLTEFALSSLRF